MTRRQRRTRQAVGVTLVTVAVLATPCPPLGAQFQQFTPVGSLGRPPSALADALRKELDEAPWDLGPVRLSPWIGFRDVAYVGNVFGIQGNLLDPAGSEESDVTATFGIGLGAFVPVGSNVIWGAHALPEYTWWAELEERNRVNGRYGTALVGDFHRFDVELSAQRAEELGVVTPEIPQRINARHDRLAGTVELGLFRSLVLVASASSDRFVHLLDEEPGPGVPRFSDLDRDEEVTRLGVRLRLGDRLQVGVGVEASDVAFESLRADRSNSGTATVLEVLYQGPNLSLRADVAERSLDPEPGTSFVPFAGTTGHVRVGLIQSRRLQLAVYGNRNLVYALDRDFSYFLDERLGASLGLGLGTRLRLRVVAEDGSNDYTALAGGGLVRRDVVESVGGEIDFRVARRMGFGLRGTQTRYESNLPGLDREDTTLGLHLDLGLGSRLGIEELAWP